MPTRTSLALVALFVAFFNLHAQEEEGEQDSKVCYVRCWLMLPSEVAPKMVGEMGTFSSPISISLLRSSGKEPEPIISDGYPYQSTGYFAVIGGRVKIAATSEFRDRERVEAMQSVNLRPGYFYTLVITGTSTVPSIQILDDTELHGLSELQSKPGQPAPPEPPKALVFFNFLPGVEFAIEQPGGKIQKVVPNSPFKMAAQREVRVAVQESGKSPVLMPLEFEFGTIASYCVILARDPYNRAAPMVVPNGLSK